ncbi:MAG: S-methyl-5-thioribose-1-phosphate isomerase [Cytophagales bacterium]|nr:MAG: S-methyl-5-thioribose-1-phosphate isomerase [Cytophagales bacterium]
MQQNFKRTIWFNEEGTLQVLDQRYLPHQTRIHSLLHSQEVVTAIKDMIVRGAPLIGATAAYGIWLACKEATNDANPNHYFEQQMNALAQSRPTAVNLFWAIERVRKALSDIPSWEKRIEIALQTANEIVEEDVEICRKIGAFGLPIIEKIYQQKQKTVNVLTHCNAGRLGCIEWGTATSPLYQAHDKGIPVHVWVDETRPRNQGFNLTAWELEQYGIPYTVITDNTGGHLMQHQMVDMVIVGTDRTTRKGDVANKIGTYLKALAAKDNQVPFYVALPSTTIDWTIADGLKEIPIEERNEEEVKWIQGSHAGEIVSVLLTPANAKAANYGFDVTPARLITGLITERGICEANEAGLLRLFPERV